VVEVVEVAEVLVRNIAVAGAQVVVFAKRGARAASAVGAHISQPSFRIPRRNFDTPSTTIMVARSYSKTYSVPRRPFESARLYVFSRPLG
jgi:hypothetical protein